MSQFLTEYQLNFWERVLAPAFVATIQMVLISSILSAVFGLLIAIVLLVTDKDGMLPNRIIYEALTFLINVIRSFPFLLLMIVLLPFTKALVGTSIGVKAAVVPLVVSTSAFIAKLILTAMKEVDSGLIEAMKSFGVSEVQIVFRVMFSEALPSIISGIILATVSILGGTAMAGTVGAGGIGTVGILYGYQKFNPGVIALTSVILVIFVELIEMLGRYVYRKLK